MKQHSAQAAPRAICLPLAGMHCADVALAANTWAPGFSSQGRVPRYLLANYWWAYVHPNAVKLFERQWLVNLILWGNYNRLRRAVALNLNS